MVVVIVVVIVVVVTGDVFVVVVVDVGVVVYCSIVACAVHNVAISCYIVVIVMYSGVVDYYGVGVRGVVWVGSVTMLHCVVSSGCDTQCVGNYCVSRVVYAGCVIDIICSVVVSYNAAVIAVGRIVEHVDVAVVSLAFGIVCSYNIYVCVGICCIVDVHNVVIVDCVVCYAVIVLL